MEASDIFTCSSAKKLWLMAADAYVFEHKKLVWQIFDRVNYPADEEARHKTAVSLISEELMNVVQSFVDNDNDELTNTFTANLLFTLKEGTTR